MANLNFNGHEDIHFESCLFDEEEHRKNFPID
jgi:hypothetical protein